MAPSGAGYTRLNDKSIFRMRCLLPENKPATDKTISTIGHRFVALEVQTVAASVEVAANKNAKNKKAIKPIARMSWKMLFVKLLFMTRLGYGTRRTLF